MARLSIDVVQQTQGTALAQASQQLQTLDNRARGASSSLDKVGGGSRDAEKGVGGFTAGLGKLAGALGIVSLIEKAGTAIVKFAGDSVEAASSMEQSLGASQAVFKGSFGQIEDASNKAALALGLSKSEYLQMSATLGAGLKNKGITDYADQTEKLVAIGADLAAQYGGSTSDAVSALASLMRGERDPIEKYGVTMNEASVQAEALRLGLVKTSVDSDKVAVAQIRAKAAQDAYNKAVKENGSASKEAQAAKATLITANSNLEKAMEGTKVALTDEQKAQATLSLLTRQTADAQGAFARESGTLAGAQQRLTATTEDLKAKVGAQLLPVMTAITNTLLGVVTGSSDLGKGLRDLGDRIGKFLTPIIDTARNAFEDVRKRITDMMGSSDGARSLMEKLGRAFEAIMPIVSKLIGDHLSRMISHLGDIIMNTIGVVNWIGNLIDKIGAVKLGPFGTIAENIEKVGNAARSAINWVSDLANKVSGVGSSIVGVFRSTDPVLGSTAAGVPIRLPEMSPVINVTLDGRQLRQIIRSEIVAQVATVRGLP